MQQHNKMGIETRLVSACFFGYGFAKSLSRAVLWMSVEDIVSGTLIQSSLPIMLFSCGDIIFRIVASMIFRKMSFLPIVVCMGIMYILGYLLLISVDQVKLRLAGAFFVGGSSGLSNVIIMFLVPCFGKTEESSSAFQVGDNTMTLVFALLYTGSTIWLCLPPRWTIAVIYPLTALVFVCYGLLNHGPLKQYQIKDHDHKNKQYTRISSNDDNADTKKHFYFMDKVYFLYEAFPFCGLTFISYCSFYLAMSSVLTTLTFPSSPFRVRDHYHYYRLCSDIGMVLGGSEVLVVSCLCPGWLNLFRIRKLWIPVLLNVGHLMFFLFAAWYHIVPNVYIVLFLSCTHGLLFGSTRVHILVGAADKFHSPYEKGLALVINGIGCAIGRLLSGLLGIFVEDYLREHCTNNLLKGQYCLARFADSVGWDRNFQRH